MKYLVIMELIGSPPASSPQEFASFLENVLIPSEEMVLKLEEEGKILAGGDLSGRRGWAFIMNAESNAELNALVSAIPEWSMMDVDVTPLDDSADRLEGIRQLLEHLKSIS